MKKNLLCLAAFMLLPLSFAVAQPNEKPIDAQYVITDCGTVRPIPKNATMDEACRELDRWSAIDCDGAIPKK